MCITCHSNSLNYKKYYSNKFFLFWNKWHWTFIFRILIAEVYGPQSSYYKNDTQPWADLHYNVELTQLNDKSSAIEIKEAIDAASKLPENAWPTFLVSSICSQSFFQYFFQYVSQKSNVSLLVRFWKNIYFS